MGVPERIRSFTTIPPGASIYEYDQAGNKTKIAEYAGSKDGWRDLR